MSNYTEQHSPEDLDIEDMDNQVDFDSYIDHDAYHNFNIGLTGSSSEHSTESQRRKKRIQFFMLPISEVTNTVGAAALPFIEPTQAIFATLIVLAISGLMATTTSNQMSKHRTFLAEPKLISAITYLRYTNMAIFCGIIAFSLAYSISDVQILILQLALFISTAIIAQNNETSVFGILHNVINFSGNEEGYQHD